MNTHKIKSLLRNLIKLDLLADFMVLLESEEYGIIEIEKEEKGYVIVPMGEVAGKFRIATHADKISTFSFPLPQLRSRRSYIFAKKWKDFLVHNWPRYHKHVAVDIKIQPVIDGKINEINLRPMEDGKYQYTTNLTPPRMITLKQLVALKLDRIITNMTDVFIHFTKIDHRSDDTLHNRQVEKKLSRRADSIFKVMSKTHPHLPQVSKTLGQYLDNKDYTSTSSEEEKRRG